MLKQLLSRTNGRSAGLLDNTSGVFVSGDPGSGKSVFARELVRAAAQSGDMAIYVLDPAGDLAEDCQRDLSDMGPSVRDRVYYFFPGDPKVPIGAINPLRVQRDQGMTDYEYQARVECRVSLAAHLLLNVFGQDSFDGAPQLYKYTTTILRSVARMVLSFADGLLFLDTGSDFYGTLVSCVPDYMARIELERLAELPPERQEELIASTKNRFVGLLSSPVAAAHLGCVEHTVPIRQFNASNAITIVNLSQGDEILSIEAQGILANIWLSEIFHDAFTTPREQRKPILIACDELPVFAPSRPLITRGLRMTRKLGVRFVGLAQGTQAFPKGTDDPLLHTMTSCANGVFFRHSDPVDCEYFGRVISLPTRDAQKVKYEHREWQQYQSGSEIVTLVNRALSTAYADAETAGGTEGLSFGRKEDTNWNEGEDQAHTKTAGTNQSGTATDGTTQADQQAECEVLIHDAFDAARRQVRGSSNAATHSNAQTAGKSQSDSLKVGAHQGRGAAKGSHFDRSLQSNWQKSRTTNYSETVQYVNQIVPIYSWREIVRVELMSLDEQDMMKATHLTRQATGQAFFYIKGQPLLQATVPMTRDWLLETPEFAARQITEFLQEMFRASFYRMGHQVIAEREKVLELALAQLQRQRRALPAPDDDIAAAQWLIRDARPAEGLAAGTGSRRAHMPDGYTHTF